MSAQHRRSINAVTTTVVDYAPDPHGAWLFGALVRSAAQSINGNGARPIAERSATFYGPVATTQSFRGAAGLGAARIYAPKGSTINDQVSTTDAPVSSIFLSRMRRGQG